MFDRTLLGRWSPARPYLVRADHLAAYAAATDDPDDRHRRGDVAAPVYAIVPPFDALLDTLLYSATPAIPPEVANQYLHSGQDFRLHRPLRPGTTLLNRVRVTGFADRRAGVAVALHVESRDQADDGLVSEQHIVCIVRDEHIDVDLGEPAPDHRMPAGLTDTPPAGTDDHLLASDVTVRYAAASGDDLPIHLDDAFARQVGLPGIIAHGMCTLAIATGGFGPLRRLAVRFTAPVRPGTVLTTRWWPDPTDPAVRRFDAVVDGTRVLGDGLAELQGDPR